ncbi:hypothetical protein BO78DRAFT_117284 [Aspergillus sclerotiicarbonarius CBS 121057]|uniref:Uncharacterized protein n=1 Tax=Aspergillus sclerotiicarbonarius (strain CBS 121057 / IBT 28362) TaxID=1448318 RepID=A0A319EIF3_ASPSB|nr:hypothetical protein BO78DRAFT_117284 [Aspergillus sclerotiicarbonarius CBS 121057]
MNIRSDAQLRMDASRENPTSDPPPRGKGKRIHHDGGQKGGKARRGFKLRKARPPHQQHQPRLRNGHGGSRSLARLVLFSAVGIKWSDAASNPA